MVRPITAINADTNEKTSVVGERILTFHGIAWTVAIF